MAEAAKIQKKKKKTHHLSLQPWTHCLWTSLFYLLLCGLDEIQTKAVIATVRGRETGETNGVLGEALVMETWRWSNCICKCESRYTSAYIVIKLSICLPCKMLQLVNLINLMLYILTGLGRLQGPFWIRISSA